jgi:hypothetical protein
MASNRYGRRRIYGVELTETLRVVSEASDRLCSRCPKLSLPEMVHILRKHGKQQINAEIEVLL